MVCDCFTFGVLLQLQGPGEVESLFQYAKTNVDPTASTSVSKELLSYKLGRYEYHFTKAVLIIL